jgi:hypothetical protein
MHYKVKYVCVEYDVYALALYTQYGVTVLATFWLHIETNSEVPDNRNYRTTRSPYEPVHSRVYSTQDIYLSL